MHKPSNPRSPSRHLSPARKLWNFALYVLIGMFCSSLLVGLKLFAETTKAGRKVEMLTYEFLHGQLQPFSPEVEMPVVVLDISKVPGGKGGGITSREKLKEIIIALAAQRPRVIAIDLDFSLDAGGWIDNDDPDFFRFCLEQRKLGVPIVLGVSRQSNEKPAVWLGSEEFKSLAADITIDSRDISRLRLWIRREGDEPLLSLSAATLRETGLNYRRTPRGLGFAVVEYGEESKDEADLPRVAKFIANYSKVEAIASQSLPATSASSVTDLGSKFTGKIVLLGDGTFGQATDGIVIPGREQSVPGVYVHASAVYSLTVEPLFELKSRTRLVLDFGLAFAAVLTVGVLRWKGGRGAVWRRLQKVVVWFMIILVLVLGVLAVRIMNVVWLDFVLVIFAFALHPSLEDTLHRMFRLSSTPPRIG